MMAPEILERKDYDSKVDIFSLGCLFFEMVYGKSPFLRNATKLEGILKNIKDYSHLPEELFP